MLTDTSLYYQARASLLHELLDSIARNDPYLLLPLVARYTEYIERHHWLAQYWHTGE